MNKTIKKYPIPQDFNEILHDFTKSIIKHNPNDILDFGCQYFRSIEEGVPFKYEPSKENVKEEKKEPSIKQETKAEMKTPSEKKRDSNQKINTNLNLNLNETFSSISNASIIKNSKEFVNNILRESKVETEKVKKNEINSAKNSDNQSQEQFLKNTHSSLEHSKHESKNTEKKEEKKEELELNKEDFLGQNEELQLHFEEAKSNFDSQPSDDLSEEELDNLINDEEPLILDKKTKIVATLGPSSSKPEIIKELFNSGVNVFRLNFSHGTHETHGEMIDKVRSLNLNCAIMLDTKGPEIRIGEIKDKIPLKIDDEFILTIDEGTYDENNQKISVNYAGFVSDVDVDDIIVIDSGILKAKCIEKMNEKDLKFKVIDGQCELTTKRHINLQGKKVSLPTVTEQDWKDIDFGIEKKVDFIALSFVRTGEDPKTVREYCKKKGVDIEIISKIENFESTQNLENIIINSDGIMFARGDLSCEIDFGKVPKMQKEVEALCSYYNRPIIIATQMILSMMTNIQPTRAEVSDIGNAIFEGVDAIMTSDETTKGLHPVSVIRTMFKIATETEDNIYAICTKPYCDDCFGIMHRGRLQRQGFENYTYHRPYHHIQRDKKLRNRNLKRQLSRKLSISSENVNKSEAIRDFRRSMSKRLSTRLSCVSVDIFPNTLKENLISIVPYVTDDIEAIACFECRNSYYSKNISASRINVPMFAFTNKIILRNQMNLIWNMQGIYIEKIVDGDFKNNAQIIDNYFRRKLVRKYLIVGDNIEDGKIMPMLQVRPLF